MWFAQGHVTSNQNQNFNQVLWVPKLPYSFLYLPVLLGRLSSSIFVCRLYHITVLEERHETKTSNPLGSKSNTEATWRVT